MPCATVHLLIADRIWERWSSGSHRPFPLGHETRSAFLHGSLAPDLGFIPGVERTVSELAHYHRPADLSRALLGEARTPVERAFAWGWIAHVLGDVEIHPLVGRAVGERIHGSRDHRMNAAEDVETHVSVEVGIDMAVRARAPDTSAPPSSPLLHASNIGWVVDALESVYGIRWERPTLARWHHVATRRTSRWPVALDTLAAGAGEWQPRSPSWLGSLLRAAARVSRPGTPARGFLSPRVPAGWVMDAFDDSLEQVVDDLEHATRHGIDDLPNRNLESGHSQEAGDPHPETAAIIRRLGTLQENSGQA